MADSLCQPGADPFIERYFFDCVYNLRDRIGFILGMTSVLCWLVAQLPQFLTNIRNQSAEALSPWFLAEWLLGDTSNLLGCLLSGEQLPTTTYTAMYFVMSDAVLMTQYIYYNALQKRRERIMKAKQRRRSRSQQALAGLDGSPQEDGTAGGSAAIATPTYAPSLSSSTAKATATIAGALAFASLICFAFLSPSSSSTSLHHPSRALLQTSTAPLVHPTGALRDDDGDDVDMSVWLGRILGVLSSFFYLMARVSQIYKNHQRGTAQGLSPIMFCMAIVANVCQGSAILTRLQTRDEFFQQLPWLMGSLGVVAMDIIIISQFVFYSGRKQWIRTRGENAEDSTTPLLHAA